MMNLMLLLFTVSIFALSVSSQTLVSNALGSHMVLQRAPQRANIWGWTTAGAAVELKFNSKTYTATGAAGTGAWNILLDATLAGGPYTIEVTSGATSVTLEDVLFGDVFVCSGQSNMQFTVHQAFNATYEIELANKYPNIRLFTVGTSTYSATPLSAFKTIAQPWSVASAATVGAGDWSEFSAACWFFGRDLYDKLAVPIGLFSDNWGGTIVQAWSSPEALKLCPATESFDKRVVGANSNDPWAKNNPIVGAGPNDPSVLWNAMIVPILPMSIKGATWYQGESNTGQANYYACSFPAMITDWRKKWGGDTDKEFGFFFVQLAPWLSGDDNSEALIRLAQIYATALPKVGVATAMDWGDASSPYGDIHPRYKQIVGHRLSLAALAITYGQAVQYKGPEASGWKILKAPPAAAVEVDFAAGTVGSGLVFMKNTCDPKVPPAQCGYYEIGTSDGKWTNATASISGATLVVSANLAAQATVSGVRYAWGNYPVATLYNKEGLPAFPFAFPNPIKPTLIN